MKANDYQTHIIRLNRSSNSINLNLVLVRCPEPEEATHVMHFPLGPLVSIGRFCSVCQHRREVTLAKLIFRLCACYARHEINSLVRMSRSISHSFSPITWFHSSISSESTFARKSRFRKRYQHGPSSMSSQRSYVPRWSRPLKGRSLECLFSNPCPACN